MIQFYNKSSNFPNYSYLVSKRKSTAMTCVFFSVSFLLLVFNISKVRNYSITLTGSRLPTPRTYTPALYDGNDAIYVVGGLGISYSVITELVRYNIASDTVEIIAPNVVPGMYGSATFDPVEQSIFYFGGHNISGSRADSKIWKIRLSDPETLIHVGDSPNACSFTSSIWNQGEYIYTIGGKCPVEVDTIVKFSKITNGVEGEFRVPSPRSGTSAVFDPDNKVGYIFGGTSVWNVGRLNDILMFNETNGLVTKLNAVLPNTLTGACAVLVELDVFIVGGNAGSTDLEFSLVKFNTVTHEVTQFYIENFRPTHGIGCAWVERLNRIYVFGDTFNTFNNGIMYIDMNEKDIVTTTTQQSISGATDIPISTTTNKITTEEPTTTTTYISLSTTTAVPEGSTPNSTSTTEESTPKSPGPLELTYIAAASIFALVFLFGLTLSIWTLYEKRKVIKAFRRGGKNMSASDPADGLTMAQQILFDPDDEIKSVHLKIDCATIGEGNFGKVSKGSYRVNGATMLVAVKSIKNKCLSELNSMILEYQVMKYIKGHDNVVQLIGVVQENIHNYDFRIVTEFCVHGSLDTYLAANFATFLNLILPNDQIGSADVLNVFSEDHDGYAAWSNYTMNTCDLLKWSYQISSGLKYLEKLKIVHCDVSTRNILLNAMKTAKICDFGLSERLPTNRSYVVKLKTFAWKWASPETQNYFRFSAEADLWSFGVTLWEIFSLGQIPYNNFDVRPVHFDNRAVELHPLTILSKPEYATQSIYNIMVRCWKIDPSERISLKDLKKFFKRTLSDVSEA